MENYQECKVVAEIGCVHLGSLDRAKMLASLAKNAGATMLKTQKRNPKESVPKEWWDKPHPVSQFAYGKTYLEHRENLELNMQQHADLKEYCESIGIIYSSSVWDMTSTKEVIELNPEMIKVPSACNHRFDMMDYLYNNYNGQIHISMGMTTIVERTKIINHVYSKAFEAIPKTVLYHCTSGYPVPFEKLYLKEIDFLNNKVRPITINGETTKFQIGFSNHGYGISADIASYILGATWIERHFVEDRALNHTDAAPSLEFDGLRRLCRDLKAVHQTLKHKPDNMDEIELEQRKKLRN
jgi:N-acetylneuraminate synthase